jgi:hypothetical protein
LMVVLTLLIDGAKGYRTKKDLIVEDILRLLFLNALVGTPAMLFIVALLLAPTIISTWWFFAIPWRLSIIIKLLEQQNLLLKNQASNIVAAITPAAPSYENSRANTSTIQTKIDEPFTKKQLILKTMILKLE